MRSRLLPAVLLLALAAACGGDGEPSTTGASVDGREVTGSIACDSITAGSVIPEAIGGGCTREDGEVFVPGLRDCSDGRLLYADGDGEAVVVGIVGTTAEQGQDAFRRLSMVCAGAPSSIPSPSPEQEVALIDKLKAAFPGITVDRAVDNARNTCTSILGGVADDRLLVSTVARFSDADADISEEAAARVLAVVRAEPWCG